VPTNEAADFDAAAERAQGNIDAAPANAADPDTVPPLTPAEPGQPGGLPDDRTPISEAPFVADSPQGAANIVQTYYALIEGGKYGQARALWGDKGSASGMSADAFAASFAQYSEYHANIGAPGDEDAGAGQRYVTVPVQVYARLKSGAARYWLGSVVLHRTVVDGGPAGDKMWRIKSIDLKPAPGKAAAVPAIAAARYRCMDGSKIAVRFDASRDTATITRAGKLLETLSGQKPASGIWYKKGGYELRGKGDAATLTTPGQPPIACTVIG
jgi:membrane-bound inhibitor of C-type lysozyme